MPLFSIKMGLKGGMVAECIGKEEEERKESIQPTGVGTCK